MQRARRYSKGGLWASCKVVWHGKSFKMYRIRKRIVVRVHDASTLRSLIFTPSSFALWSNVRRQARLSYQSRRVSAQPDLNSPRRRCNGPSAIQVIKYYKSKSLPILPRKRLIGARGRYMPTRYVTYLRAQRSARNITRWIQSTHRPAVSLSRVIFITCPRRRP